jgi:hypothetical protein
MFSLIFVRGLVKPADQNATPKFAVFRGIVASSPLSLFVSVVLEPIQSV